MTTVYAKLENGVMTYAPETIFVDGVKETNITHEMIIEAGYLPVKPTDAPETEWGFIAVPIWEQTECEIVRTWRVIPDTHALTESEVSRLLIAQQINTLSMDDNTALRMVEFFPGWTAGVAYTTGYKVQRSGKLWRCLQAHTSQTGWEPESAPSLWAKVLIPDENVVPEWEQPDSTNPYSAGDKVSHNGKTWVSDIDNNVWEPGVYGWTEIE